MVRPATRTAEDLAGPSQALAPFIRRTCDTWSRDGGRNRRTFGQSPTGALVWIDECDIEQALVEKRRPASASTAVPAFWSMTTDGPGQER